MSSKREQILEALKARIAKANGVKTVTRKIVPVDQIPSHEMPVVYIKETPGTVIPLAQGEQEGKIHVLLIAVDRERGEEALTRVNELMEAVEKALVPDATYQTLSLGLDFVTDIAVTKSPDIDEALREFKDFACAGLEVQVSYYYRTGAP